MKTSSKFLDGTERTPPNKKTIKNNIYIYNSEDVANYWVEKKQGLSSSTLLIIRE